MSLRLDVYAVYAISSLETGSPLKTPHAEHVLSSETPTPHLAKTARVRGGGLAAAPTRRTQRSPGTLAHETVKKIEPD